MIPALPRLPGRGPVVASDLNSHILKYCRVTRVPVLVPGTTRAVSCTGTLVQFHVQFVLVQFVKL